jgi:GNAT superfamily N-acetyltransferase
VTGVLKPPILFNSRAHDASGFASGVDHLDRWLRHSAGQNQRRDTARTFVVTTVGPTVIAYYTLVAAQLDHEDATTEVRHRVPQQFPIPVALIARLAVDQRHQARGLGAALLRDALRRVVGASEQVAMRAVVVHAVDERAADFYRHFGFRTLSSAPFTLMVTLSELRAAET